jgi:hypothetical protein
VCSNLGAISDSGPLRPAQLIVVACTSAASLAHGDLSQSLAVILLSIQWPEAGPCVRITGASRRGLVKVAGKLRQRISSVCCKHVTPHLLTPC